MFLGDFRLLCWTFSPGGTVSHEAAILFARLNLSINTKAAMGISMHKLLKRTNQLGYHAENLKDQTGLWSGIAQLMLQNFQTSASDHDDPVSTFGAGRKALQRSQKPPDQSSGKF